MMADRFAITYQRARGQIGPDGSFQNGMEVGFTVQPEGVQAHLWFPLTQYNPENVKAAITDYVARIADVHNL